MTQLIITKDKGRITFNGDNTEWTSFNQFQDELMIIKHFIEWLEEK